MEIKKFIENYREAFGEYAELPIVFWYSDILENETAKVNGCFFKSMSKVREGKYHQPECGNNWLRRR